MNTSLTHSVAAAPGRHDHPPQPVRARQARPARLPAFLDRAALHLGLALIAWGRRAQKVESREQRANRTKQSLARLARERAAERWIHLHLPPR